MKALAHRHKRYGSPRLHILLKKEGLVINHKRTERIYREEGLSLKGRKTKKRIPLVRIQMPAAHRANEVWSMDFMSDALSDGRRFKILTVVDDFSRFCPAILAERSIPAVRVTALIDQISSLYGSPRRIRVDNGPEFTSAAFHGWAAKRKIQVEHIRPGRPMENPYIESFNGKFRDECLNEHWFLSLQHARETIELWRRSYNDQRPHSSLNGMTPYEYVKEQAAISDGHGLNLQLAHRMG
jgi:putative transposase